eukprot:s232_g23.t1
MSHKIVDLGDFGFAHDLCCGLGGFSTALDVIGLETVSAVDTSRLALNAYSLNHQVPTFQEDVGSSDLVFKLHEIQISKQIQPLICAGFPCQPLSSQGWQQGASDPRSATLKSLARCAFWLQSCGLALECVPEAFHDQQTQHILQALAKLLNLQVLQRVVHLDHVWPMRRNRWFALLVPFHVNLGLFDDLPVLSPSPVVHDLIPYTLWPTWSFADEEQLKWTDLEKQAYRNPEFGNPNRRIVTSEPMPTALHSWGSALYGCPCGCRQQGFSVWSLKRKGLRGIEIVSSSWPHASRHIHPRELQLFMGFSPLDLVLPDCRAQLCLYGNAVSPIQAIWILAHLSSHLGLGSGLTPLESVRQHMIRILDERNVTWPSPSAGDGFLTLEFAGHSQRVAFTTTQTVGNLLRAEAALSRSATQHVLKCEGITLPSFAFLQERTYQLETTAGAATLPYEHVPVFLFHLGEMQLIWVPASMTYHGLLHWAGIHDFLDMIDDRSCPIQGDTEVVAWTQVIVRLHPDTVALDLELYAIGLGPVDASMTCGSFRTSRSWVSTGLWSWDQLIKSHAFVSWVGSGFRAITIWLPSFAAAVLESWPSMIDDKLASWFHTPDVTVYAIAHEDWGWMLVKMSLNVDTFQVTYYEVPGHSSVVAAHTAYRAFKVSKRRFFVEVRNHQHADAGDQGSLQNALHTLDAVLGIPICLTKAIHGLGLSSLDFSPDQPTISPTLPWTCDSTQGMPSALIDVPTPGKGLSVGFMRQLVHEIFQHDVDCAFDVKVLVDLSQLVRHSSLSFACPTVASKPVLALLLLDRHWILLRCTHQDSRLHIQVYDGLASSSLAQLQSLCDTLKTQWNLSHVYLEHCWVIPQQHQHTCGTVALGHMLLLADIITFEQAMLFEAQHDGLTQCDPFQHDAAQIGFGPDEAIVESLEQILPSKGVPPTEVSSRAAAAIKAFGRAPIQKALQAGNVWAALKQLGNSRPKPFMWVHHDELQAHIKDRATTKYGAQLDIKRARKQKESKSVPVSQHVDPTNLVLPAGLFATNCGTPLPQLSLSGVVKNARGIAFATASDAMQYATEGKFISPEGLALLIVGSVPDAMPKTLPMHQLRVPAIYRATNEPVLLDCTSIQLGDQAVYQPSNASAPEVQVFPSVVFRAHFFRDAWEQEGAWSDLVDHPGKAWLVGTEAEPPSPFLEAQHGWISISKVRDQVPQPRSQDLIATARTKQHIKEQSSATAAATAHQSDPWLAGSDPWSGYTPAHSVAASSTGPSQHVQQKFDEVEQKLNEQVKSTLQSHLQQADQASSSRIQSVECQINSLIENQQKMQMWIQDGSSKIHDLRQDYTQLHSTLQTCTAQNHENAAAIAGVVNDLGICNSNLVQQGQALQGVAQDLSAMKDNLTQSLDAYFDRQAEKIESLLSKRQRRD